MKKIAEGGGASGSSSGGAAVQGPIPRKTFVDLIEAASDARSKAIRGTWGELDKQRDFEGMRNNYMKGVDRSLQTYSQDALIDNKSKQDIMKLSPAHRSEYKSLRKYIQMQHEKANIEKEIEMKRFQDRAEYEFRHGIGE